MNIWRLHEKEERKFQYCIDCSVAALGWSLENENDRENIKKYEDWFYFSKLKKRNSVSRLAQDVKQNDIIWMRNNGKYYIARVMENSIWKFDAGKEATSMDACNQLTNIKWYPISEYSDESSVPGAISTAFIKGSAFQRIHKDGVEEFSKITFNKIADDNSFKYEDIKLKLNEKTFYNMLQPEDAEDLLCMWLYKEKGYICIPSTNKISTPLYECVLIDPNTENNKHIYIQVKKGNVTLKVSDYCKLYGEVYLLTTEGNVLRDTNCENIIIVNPTELYDFAIDPENSTIIPESISIWIEFLSEKENDELLNGSYKGIMFDTNLSYSSNDEQTMLLNSLVAAYGNAQKFIYRFLKGDYVFYYSKGQGVFAVGQIISEAPLPFDTRNGAYHKVKMIVPSNDYDWNSLDKFYISPREIKTILNRGFYFASTIKTPYLIEEQCQELIKTLKDKYQF